MIQKSAFDGFWNLHYIHNAQLEYRSQAQPVSQLQSRFRV